MDAVGLPERAGIGALRAVVEPIDVTLSFRYTWQRARKVAMSLRLHRLARGDACRRSAPIPRARRARPHAPSNHPIRLGDHSASLSLHAPHLCVSAHQRPSIPRPRDIPAPRYNICINCAWSGCSAPRGTGQTQTGMNRRFMEPFEVAGRRIRIDRFSPSGSGPHSAVLILHGADGLPGRGLPYRDMAVRFAANGYLAFLLHYFDATDDGPRPNPLNPLNFAAWMTTIGEAVGFALQQRDAPRFGWSRRLLSGRLLGRRRWLA